MVNFTIDQIEELMNYPVNIRNMSVIAHVDHGKSTLTDSLVMKAGIIAAKKAGDMRFMDTRKDEQERGITIKSTAISMYFELPKVDLADLEEKTERTGFLINLIDSPGHVDFSSEVTAALRVTDGAVVVVDTTEGVCVQTETVLRQALNERIKPVLVVNKVDRGFQELKLKAPELYMNFFKVVESVNALISMYQEDDERFDYRVSPERGTVAFGSGLQGWCFTLRQFGKKYAELFKCDKSKIIGRLWGDNYFNKKSNKWRKMSSDECAALPDRDDWFRGFELFILDPIMRIYCKVEELGDSKDEAKWKDFEELLKKLKIVLDDEEKVLRERALAKCCLKKYLPAADALLEMIVLGLPSPKKAQAYRCELLYEGPMDDECAKAIKTCDADGPLMLYVSKMVPTNDKGRFYAFGRVFSGTVSCGQKVRIQGPNYEVGGKFDLNVKNVQRTMLMMGRSVEAIEKCPCGNIVGLVGIDQFLAKTGTITTHEQAHNLKVMKFSVSPVVQVAVDVVNQKDIGRLAEGLKRLSKSDPCVLVKTSESGQHIICGAGELHLEICLKDLEEEHACVPLKHSPPVVQYRESIAEACADSVLAKSSNSHNRIWMRSKPVCDDICNDVENSKILWLEDVKERAKKITSAYSADWDANDARKIWAFGPGHFGPNFFVDATKGIQELNEIKDSCILAFQDATREGVLCRENMRACRFDITDATLHSDSVHRGSPQITPACRKAIFASFLMSEPILLEPYFLVQIQTTSDHLQGVYKAINSKRGAKVISTDQKPNSSQVNVNAYLPIAESFKFTELLRSYTSGQAFNQSVFDHWKQIPGSYFDLNSKVATIIAEIRKRKEMKPEFPKAADYYDKL